MKRNQIRAVNARYNVVMYDVVTRDYSNKLNPEQVFKNVTRYVRNGSIVVFHDSLKAAPNMLVALPKALRWLKRKGYEFKTL
jgi:peptidoglycan/xylan/chitin deacetylase (PgdA/CDA1 family)